MCWRHRLLYELFLKESTSETHAYWGKSKSLWCYRAVGFGRDRSSQPFSPKMPRWGRLLVPCFLQVCHAEAHGISDPTYTLRFLKRGF